MENVIICSISIVLVILLGHFTRTNIGLWAITAAYLFEHVAKLKMEWHRIHVKWRTISYYAIMNA